MGKDTKIIISHNDEKCIVGIQIPDCDPIYYTPNGDLPTVIAGIMTEVEETKVAWAEKKRYPEAKLPPAPEPVTAGASKVINSTATVKKTEAPLQPSFDL